MTKLVYQTNIFFSTLFQLKSLERRLGKDPYLREQYSTVICDEVSKIYIVKVGKTNHPNELYWPQHPVFHTHKPGKVRQVFNGAAKFDGHSLNNALVTAPDLLQNLIYVLLRFRKHLYAVYADIEGIFLQVGVFPNDRSFFPFFLWREDSTTKVAVFQYTYHIFGTKDSPTGANYALQRTAKNNQNEFAETSESVRNNFY